MDIFPKYDIEEYVVYEKKVYKITHIYVGWVLDAPFVYGIVLAHTKSYANKELYVIESLLQKASASQIGVWKTLYGDN